MARQKRAVRTRALLLVSAADIFRRHGFAEASLTVIRDEAGVSSGALYFHFENKAALASAVVEQATGTLHACARHVDSERTSALQSLVDTTHTFGGLLREDVVVQAGFQLSSSGHGGSRLTLRQEWQRCVTQLLKEADHERTLAPEGPYQRLSALITTATIGHELLGRDNREWLSPQVITHFWQLQLPILVAPHALEDITPEGSPLTRSALRAVSRLEVEALL